MFFRKPEMIPVLFIIAAVGLCGFLGAWQLERLEWKETLIADIKAAQAKPTFTTVPANLNGLEYRKVLLRGLFDYDHTLRKVGSRHGERSGFALLTPLLLPDGRAILVNRGFAPGGEAPRLAEPQTVEGVLRPARGKRAFFIPDNHPQENVWVYEDIAAMSQATGHALLPLIVEATGGYEKGVYPIPNDGKINLRNDHLGYAITWFALAIAALVLFGVYYRKRLTL